MSVYKILIGKPLEVGWMEEILRLASQVFRLAKTHQHLFYGSLEELEKISKWKKNNVLKALVA